MTNNCPKIHKCRRVKRPRGHTNFTKCVYWDGKYCAKGRLGLGKPLKRRMMKFAD